MMWKVIGASAKGTSHINIGVPCQDAHGFRVFNDYVIAAVADGLGSAIRSHEGSKRAISVSLEVLEEALKDSLPTDAKEWTQILKKAFIKVRASLDQHAMADSTSISDFGTTLIVAAATEDWLAIGHIGDGYVVAFFDDDKIETVSKPHRGEYFNETISVTSVNAIDNTNFSVYQVNIKAVALLTDGLQNLSVNTSNETPYLPFFKPFFDGIGQISNVVDASEQLENFLNSDRVCNRTDDDKTLIVIGKMDV